MLACGEGGVQSAGHHELHVLGAHFIGLVLADSGLKRQKVLGANACGLCQ